MSLYNALQNVLWEMTKVDGIRKVTLKSLYLQSLNQEQNSDDLEICLIVDCENSTF